MRFAILHRRPYFDQIPVRIIEAYDLLSPAVRHESVDVFHFRVIPFKLLDKTFDFGFFKVELAGIALRKDFLSEKLLPVFLLLKNQSFRQDHVSVIVKDHLKTEQIMVEPSGSLNVFHNDQDILQLHLSVSFPTPSRPASGTWSRRRAPRPPACPCAAAQEQHRQDEEACSQFSGMLLPHSMVNGGGRFLWIYNSLPLLHTFCVPPALPVRPTSAEGFHENRHSPRRDSAPCCASGSMRQGGR